MSDSTPNTPNAGLFAPATPAARGLPPVAWAAAGLVILALLAALLFAGRHRSGPAPNAALPLDPYAPNLPISGLVMSESTSLSGGKSIFIDGHLGNTGPGTLTAISIQVFFRNDENMPPAIETLPIPLIRTRQPYVDTQPVSAAPLKPGDDREFRLIFENLPSNWNVQLPEIHVVRVTSR